MRRHAAILSLAVAAALAAGEGGIWLDVPFVKQVENGCGSATLSMTMQYWQQHGASVNPQDVDAATIQKQLYSPEDRGIASSAMRQYLEMHGFRALAFRGRWEDLREQLSKGRPLIAAIRSGADTFHYVVVAGVGGGTIEVNDAADRKLRQIPRAEFEKKWKATGNWTLLAVPRSGS